MSAATQHLIVTSEIPAFASEDAAFALSEIGCQGIAEEPILGAKTVRIRASFPDHPFTEETLASAVAAAFAPFPELRSSRIEIALTRDADWIRDFKQSFKPFPIAPGIIVVPSWETYAPAPGERVIHLDPGMAFGTGLHPTTKLCARELGRLHEELPSGARSLLDLGTGSGILAILWRLLRPGTIVAIDNDPDAIEVAKENCQKNHTTEISFGLDVREAARSFDVVVANILQNPLLELRPEILRCVAPKGRLILSGITNDQEETLLATFSPSFDQARVNREGEWSAIAFERR